MFAVTQATIRYSSRVLVLDGEDRLFLFHSAGPGDVPTLWFPPGGGLEDGESHEEAAIRELREEVGLSNIALERCVWHRNVVVRWGDGLLDSRERWFVARVEGLDLDGHINPDEVESSLTLGFRWWSLDEIVAATQEVFVPRQLGALLGPVLRGDYPAAPIEIGL